MTAVDDAVNAFCGKMVDAARDNAPALVEAAQKDQADALTQARADVSALTLEVDNLTAQGERDRQALAADVESIKALEQRHASDAATIGQRDATITQQAARIAELEAQVPTPLAVVNLVGATLRNTSGDPAKKGGNTSQDPRPVWDIVRTYNQDDALAVFDQTHTWTEKSTGRTFTYAPGLRGLRVATSYGAQLGGKGWENSQAKRDGLIDSLAALPDIEGNRVGDTHEFDNPAKYGTDVTSYLAGGAAFKRAVATVNQDRDNPLIIFRCCMAYSLSVKARNIDAFYLQDPENYDEFGPDVYKLPDIDLVVEKAVQYGKPLCIPEFGPLDNVAHIDSAISNEMTVGLAAWDEVPTTWRAWFDKKDAGADLDDYPGALGIWTGAIVGI